MVRLVLIDAIDGVARHRDQQGALDSGMRPGRLSTADGIPAGGVRRFQSPSICYESDDDRWWLWWPCRACGGVRLPLLARPPLHNSVYDLGTLSARLSQEECPGCETRRRRAGAGRAGTGAGSGTGGRVGAGGRAGEREREPTVCYDTLLGDWVLQLPAGVGVEAILPLEIRWFDAAEALIYRTASDFVHSGDAFEP